MSEHAPVDDGIIASLTIREYIRSFDRDHMDTEVMQKIRTGMQSMGESSEDAELVDVAVNGTDDEVIAALELIVNWHEDTIFSEQ